VRHWLLALILLLPLTLSAQKKQTEVKIQKTSMTRDREIQLGKEAAAQVQRQMEVLQNPEIESWLNQIGQQLAKTPQANAYPYYFKLVNDDSINAFALPGGPMFVHTGLIKAADTEGEVAGVLAHEMSHVALRHGAAQMGKQQTWGTLFGVIGAVAGVAATGEDGSCSLLCQAAQMGAGLGGNSVLMKFSRGYERDADLNGARMMASASYNPIELANFFEKLSAKAGSASEPKGLALWLSSHPASGSRTQYVAEDIRTYPKRDYNNSTGKFMRVKQLVASLPPPKLKPAALLQAKQGPARPVPAGFKDYQAVGFSIAYPAAWHAGQSAEGGSLYLIPQGGATQSKSGGIELFLGAMVDYYLPEGGAVNLDSSTAEFVQILQKSDKNLRADRSTRAEIGGKPALLTRLTTKTSSNVEADQTAFLYTSARDTGLWYVVLATPPSKLAEYEPIFRQIAQTVKFPD
jgi:Zn-dependent protease with chaperone function